MVYRILINYSIKTLPKKTESLKVKNFSYLDTMVHMIKGSMGAGVLAMPEAVRRVGVFTSIFALLFIGFFAAYCIQLLVSTLLISS